MEVWFVMDATELTNRKAVDSLSTVVHLLRIVSCQYGFSAKNLSVVSVHRFFYWRKQCEIEVRNIPFIFKH